MPVAFCVTFGIFRAFDMFLKARHVRISRGSGQQSYLCIFGLWCRKQTPLFWTWCLYFSFDNVGSRSASLFVFFLFSSLFLQPVRCQGAVVAPPVEAWNGQATWGNDGKWREMAKVHHCKTNQGTNGTSIRISSCRNCGADMF